MPNTTQLHLPCGPVKAALTDNLIHARGIPYATAARFQPPEPTETWTIPLDCTARAPICPQLPSRLGSVMGLGLLDQIAAPRCGDPANLTLAGQSAGADSIVCMMAAEGTRGLFHWVILLSPPLGKLHGRAETRARLAEKAETLMTKDPREMTTAELLDLQKKLLLDRVWGRHMLFAPAFGAYPLPSENAVESKIVETARGVPVLVRWTAHDGRPFASMSGPLCSLYSMPFSSVSTAACQAGCASTTCSFDWGAQDNPLQACHTIDIQFVLGAPGAWEKPMLQGAMPKTSFVWVKR
ncbi:para-nitrobenzyl esterase [Aspergillus terreus]|uniref:Para-nitrobenzyl esterase n=1 Tax=Aspergillus terreus TaxID=33178 RepID=A0A5M3YSY5_ASPTE|nr:hypothetical protein ATETN484_0003028300 [Aspergillus terreus]GFF14272.1 para-nitrobenzyl esterase [Aspergillus terreus]